MRLTRALFSGRPQPIGATAEQFQTSLPRTRHNRFRVRPKAVSAFSHRPPNKLWRAKDIFRGRTPRQRCRGRTDSFLRPGYANGEFGQLGAGQTVCCSQTVFQTPGRLLSLREHVPATCMLPCPFEVWVESSRIPKIPSLSEHHRRIWSISFRDKRRL